MPKINTLNPQLGDLVFVYVNELLHISMVETDHVYPNAAHVIAKDSIPDFWLGWYGNPPLLVSGSLSLHRPHHGISYSSNWKDFPYTILLGGHAAIHSIAGPFRPVGSKLDQPCRQCGRGCTPGDNKCWFCETLNPC